MSNVKKDKNNNPKNVVNFSSAVSSLRNNMHRALKSTRGNKRSSSYAGNGPNRKLKKNIVEMDGAKFYKMSNENFKDFIGTYVGSREITNGELLEPIDQFVEAVSSMTKLVSHPEADKYKERYGELREELANKLYAIFNREIFFSKLPLNMAFNWNNRLQTTSASCQIGSYQLPGNGGVTKRFCIIDLSSKLLINTYRLSNSLLHEMCHAATWIIDDRIDYNHGEVWQVWANRVASRFPCLPPVCECHDYPVLRKYTYTCENCGLSFQKQRKVNGLSAFCCSSCNGKFIVTETNKL